MYIIDLDDFHEKNHKLEILEDIKRKLPKFKATLFTIIGRCSDDWIEMVKIEYPWLDMVPHGLVHENSYECSKWNYEECVSYLNWISRYKLTHGFKAPGWQISDDMYKALLEYDYWVADQAYNDDRRPSGLRAYILDAPNKLHFHIQDVCDNGLEKNIGFILTLGRDSEFRFIKDVI